MVAAQTGPPVRLGMYSWGAQASLTRSFTQIIPALGSLEHTMLANPPSSVRPMPLPQEERSARAVSADMTVYTPIPPPGSVMVPMGEFPSGTTQGSVSLSICVGGNETDSGISSVSHSTPVKPRGPDQHLTSTPKTQLKLMQTAHRLTAKLSAKWQAAPHGAHIQDREGSAQKGWGGEFRDWEAPSKIRNASLDSSVVSLDDHTQLSTKLLMERDDPTQNCSAFSGGGDILSVNDSSDIEMTSIVDVPAHPSGESAPVTGSEDEGETPANDPGVGGHPSSNPEYDSGNEGPSSGSDSGSGSDSPGSDDDDEFGDMFSPGGTLQPIERKPESQAQSNSRSWSRESEPHKRTLTPSPENEPNPDKPERKKKKSSSGKSGTPKGVPTPNPEAIDKMAQDIGEELIRDLQGKDDQDRRSQSKKTKKDSDREAEKVAREKEEEEWKRKKKKKREKEAKERKEKEEQEAKKRAEEEQLASNKRSARAKLIHTARLEKYDEELLELERYWQKFISNIQRTTVNLDSHIRYLELVMEDKSLYPNRNCHTSNPVDTETQRQKEGQLGGPVPSSR